MTGPKQLFTRIAKASLWLLAGGLLTVALLPDGTVRATDPEAGIQAGGSKAVQSETPTIQRAPQRTPVREPFPRRTGFVPPAMDLSHLTGQRIPERAAAAGPLPPQWDWQDTGKVTPVKNQGDCGSCYAFATIGSFESKLLIDSAGPFDLSENHAKECNWRELNGFEDPPGTPWGSCSGGNPEMLASLFSQTGTVLEACDPYVASDVGCTSTCAYEKTLLDWRIISWDSIADTEALKQYIYDHGPVITAMYVDESQGFDDSYHGYYTFNYTATEGSTNHLVLITGWGDNLPPEPGDTGPAEGWIVKNSWGTGWGDNGYFYITYGAANIGMYSSYVHDWQDYDPDGTILYYDDDGWSSDTGCDNLTAYALARFIPDEDTWATRVEFWTNDATTDVDVYLFDGFDGSSFGNLLAYIPDNAFAEAGYHSVALDEREPMTSGDDIVVMVKLTNEVHKYPIAIDVNGPIETGRTYLSCDLSSWQDMGSFSGSDVAIRLRASRGPDATVVLTKTVVSDNGGTLLPVDFQAHIDGNPVSWNAPLSISAGTHVVSETAEFGYEALAWGGDCDADGTLETAPAGVYTCTITNDDIAPTVTLSKTVRNDNGGTLTEVDFQPYINDQAVSWMTPTSIPSGTYTVSETLAPGYAPSVWAGACGPDGTLTVQVGGVYTCTIINYDIAPTVTLSKTVINDNGGTQGPGNFYPYVDGDPVVWGTPIELPAGSHTVSETQILGYEASAWGDDCASDGSLTMTLGSEYVCSITNDDIGPTVTSIAPNTGVNTDTVHITDLAGSNFQPGAEVRLSKAGQPHIIGSVVSVESASKITCDLDLNEAAEGSWDVVVTNPDSRFGVLPEGFAVQAVRFILYVPLLTRQ